MGAYFYSTGRVINRDTSFLSTVQTTEQNKERLDPQQSGYAEFPLGVFLLSTPQREYQGSNRYRNIAAFDKLQILVDDGFTSRFIANQNELVTDVVRKIMTDAGISKINLERSDVRFPTWMDWSPDVSRLEVVNDLLRIINYDPVYVDEYGYFISRPHRNPDQRGSEYTYETDQLSVIGEGATVTEDTFDIPNEWVGIVSEPDRVPLTYTYQNTNPDSPTSIPNRGRKKTSYIDVDAVDLASLQGIVQKQAFEDSQIFTEMQFNTALMPHHSYNDVFTVRHDPLGINARFQETGWQMPLSAGAMMTHTVKQIIRM
ncbi:hypothetical protein JCM19038_2827 [Geomicrobium sp. JCM 19038]|nr:hypothetical protein JCM19038_2827 [Geomicrobium sp. JCM 19038]